MADRRTIRSMLAGGDLRSIGRGNEVAALVLGHPTEFGTLIECLWDSDPVISMRAADAAEKASREQPQLLQPFKAELLGLLGAAIQKELRWHLAVMIPRLQLAAAERSRAWGLLQSYLADGSSIVRTCAMQGISDLAQQDQRLREPALELLRSCTRTGTPAMRARGWKLIQLLERQGPL